MTEHLEALVRAIGAEIAAEVRAGLVRTAVVTAEDELHPDASYDYGDVARFLGVKRESVRGIPETLLPRETGVRGRVRGVDIMAYRGEITREEARAYKQARRLGVLRLIKKGEAA